MTVTDDAAEPISTTAPGLAGRAVASQRWADLAFVHWRVDAALVAPLLPPGVRPDVFDGSSWVGLIGFELQGASIFGSPSIPYFGTFGEINVRLYGVDSHGRRGVVFASLEASRLAAVIAARAAFSIPYFWSATRLIRRDGVYEYSSHRHGSPQKRTRLAVRPSTRVVSGDPLADFLTARWALFASRGGSTTFLPNAHEPWDLFEATLESLDDTLVAASGLPGIVGRAPDSVLYSPGVTSRFGRGSRL
jgi:uncharacterized protein YqjF (DUF2071 family)